MDRDDIQQHRHAARFTAIGLSIFHEEMRKAGLPRLVAGALTIEHYRMLMRPDFADEIAEAMSRMQQAEQDDDD